jgi:hypothetical protein
MPDEPEKNAAGLPPISAGLVGLLAATISGALMASAVAAIVWILAKCN